MVKLCHIWATSSLMSLFILVSVGATAVLALLVPDLKTFKCLLLISTNTLGLLYKRYLTSVTHHSYLSEKTALQQNFTVH